MKKIIRILMICCALTTHFALSGCGGGGGGTQNSAVTPVTAANTYSLSHNDLEGLPVANVLNTERDNAGGFTLRAQYTRNVSDINPADVFRIDILQPSLINVAPPDEEYSVGSSSEHPKFPGNINFFSGENSTMLKTVSGSIKFTKFSMISGKDVDGTFDVWVTDGNSTTQYHIAGSFHYVLDL